MVFVVRLGSSSVKASFIRLLATISLMVPAFSAPIFWVLISLALIF